MDYEMILESKERLSFSECNILKAAIFTYPFSKGDFLYWMDCMIQNTKDKMLVREAERLTDKIIPLSEEQFDKLAWDVNHNTVIFPPNYNLPE